MRQPIPDIVRAEIEHRRGAAREASVHGDPARAWNLLADAHVLSQPWALPHTAVHWQMFRLALATRSRTEIVGQMMRLALAGVGSMSGRVPLGNTGRSDVSAFAPMAVNPELATLLDGYVPGRARRLADTSAPDTAPGAQAVGFERT